MPAAAVIPAPIAYIKVVAVKKLVVEFLAGVALALVDVILSHPYEKPTRSSSGGWCIIQFTKKKLECFRQAIAGIHKHGIME